jgi:hypothetical protein
MNIDQYQQHLKDVHNESPDLDVQNTAQQTHQYTELFKTGQISKDEYIQTLADLQRVAMIHRTMDNMQSMESLNSAITGLISLASLV